jgi:hypothetical protein
VTPPDASWDAAAADTAASPPGRAYAPAPPIYGTGGRPDAGQGDAGPSPLQDRDRNLPRGRGLFAYDGDDFDGGREAPMVRRRLAQPACGLAPVGPRPADREEELAELRLPPSRGRDPRASIRDAFWGPDL